MSFLRRYSPYLALGILALASLGIWSAVVAATPPGVLTVAVIDVGQGDSLYIESPTGVQIVIDAGPDNSLLSELATLMPLADRTLDAAIETHPDADHISGFIDLLKHYEVEVFIEPGVAKNTLTAQTLERQIDAQDIPRVIARRGMWLELGGGARLNILYPDFDVSVLKSEDANEGAIVAQLVYASTTMLLMADAPKEVENRLLELDGVALRSDLLKVGHHGSAGSSGEAFIATVNPAAAIISLGARNKYGFPKQAVIETLDTHDIKTLRTDEEGTIVFESNGREFERVR